MDEADSAFVIEQLQKPAFGFHDIRQRSEFLAYRTRKDGLSQEVTITILDAGPNGKPGLRYYAQARSKEGLAALSNGASTIEGALATVHWSELDGDPS